MGQGSSKYHGLLALSPLLVFLCVYLVSSIVAQDFYKIPVSVAFLIASIYALIISRGKSLEEKIDIFSSGAGHKNVLLMIWIFVMAGAFAATAKEIGAIDATVNLALKILPGKLLYAGLFLAACFISMSIGTSVGTIVALTPIAAGKTIPANTGVILKGEKGTYPFAKAEDAEAIADNVLTGTASGIATSSIEGVVYTLQQDGDKVVFKEYAGVALAAGKAYLVLDPNSASAISIRFGGSTDIDAPELTILNSEFIYDLMGRRVENPGKGMYIVNGRKVVF